MSGLDQDDATSFDVTALLDILSNIIFFLMASFGATLVVVLPIQAPTVSDDKPEPNQSSEDRITVVMSLERSATVRIVAQGNTVKPELLKNFELTIPGVGGSINTEVLREHLWTIKQLFSKSKDIIVVPNSDVLYSTLVEAMDAARERIIEDQGKQIRQKLFPAVIVSSINPAQVARKNDV